ncbi:MAG: ATP-binding protein [Dehalococcoidia bacterium]|nr:ATP-binding protein [Dehalococcoidia bacterium]
MSRHPTGVGARISDDVLLDLQRARVVAELAAITVHDFANVLAGVLASVRHIADQLGGEIDVESTTGAGTRFTLVLQAARSRAEGEAAG